MKKHLLLGIMVILLIISMISCELLLEKPGKPTIHALFVSLDYYDLDQKILDGTINDAEEVAVALNLLAGEYFNVDINTSLMFDKHEDTSPIGDRYPTKNNIRQKIEEYALDSTINENDIFFFYYSGHGGESDQPMVVAETEGNSATVNISTQEFATWIQPINAQKIIILDSCFSGQVIEDYPRTYEDRQIQDYDPNAFYLSAASDSQLSSEATFSSIGHRHGYFTLYLLDAIGWNHVSETNTDLTIDSRDLSVPGKLDSKDDIPTFTNGNILIGDVFRYITYAFRYTEGWISSQTPQTGDGPLDLVLFSEHW
ncbi:MAG: caspase family protein [Sphaerochaetaceae bacterium]